MKTKTTIVIMGEIQYTKYVEIEWEEEDPDGFRNAAAQAVSEAEGTPTNEWEGDGETVTAICYSE